MPRGASSRGMYIACARVMWNRATQRRFGGGSSATTHRAHGTRARKAAANGLLQIREIGQARVGRGRRAPGPGREAYLRALLEGEGQEKGFTRPASPRQGSPRCVRRPTRLRRGVRDGARPLQLEEKGRVAFRFAEQPWQGWSQGNEKVAQRFRRTRLNPARAGRSHAR